MTPAVDITSTYTIAIDSGGTFTDCVAIATDGSMVRGKAPSTPSDYSIGAFKALSVVADQLGLSVEELLGRTELFGHGTTVATNTLLTRTGGTTGLLTTNGHEDAVIIGRTYQKVAGLNEAELADVARLEKAEPIVPRELIHGVTERIDARGTVIVPLDLDTVREALDRVVSAGVEAVAVSLLWSFINPIHEQAIVRLIESEYPGLDVSVSHRLAPVIREYERGATTMINAYLLRRTSQYLETLHNRLRTSGLASTPVVMQSSGGVLPVELAKTRPVSLLTSGPAGGVIGAQALGATLGYPNIVTTDVGGTSFDVGIVVDHEPQIASVGTFSKYELVMPIIDIETIGAGGGSLAWIEPDKGVLHVGPQSAGANPGPACYGLGGTEATVTDANVVLGRVNPDFFLGGAQPLDAERARAAVAVVADSLGMTMEEAAMGIVDIADAHMADLVRQVTIERGFDPRTFVTFAFGGAGPLHAASYGPAAGCRAIVVPMHASEFSAFGIAGSDAMVVAELSEPMFSPFEPAAFAQMFVELEQRARETLAEAGLQKEVRLVRYVRLRYPGQAHEVDTPVPDGSLSAAELERTIDEFERIYEAKYGRGTAYHRASLQAITFRVNGFGRLHTPSLARYPMTDPEASSAIKELRDVCFRDADGFAPTTIYDAARLRPGHAFGGPAVVEAADTTVVVHPGQLASVDPYLNIVINAPEGA